MNYWMDRYNSNMENSSFNQNENGMNLAPTNIPSKVPDGAEKNGIDLNERSNNTKGGISMSGTSRTISEFVRGVASRDLIISESLLNNTRSSLQM